MNRTAAERARGIRCMPSPFKGDGMAQSPLPCHARRLFHAIARRHFTSESGRGIMGKKRESADKQFPALPVQSGETTRKKKQNGVTPGSISSIGVAVPR